MHCTPEEGIRILNRRRRKERVEGGRERERESVRESASLLKIGMNCLCLC